MNFEFMCMSGDFVCTLAFILNININYLMF